MASPSRSAPSTAPAYSQPHPKLVPPDPGRLRRQRKRWILAASALIALLAALAIWQLRRSVALAPTVVQPLRTVKVRRASVEQSIRLAGVTAAARSAVLLAPQLPGSRRRGLGQFDFTMVLQRVGEAGARVKKGDIVAGFDQQYMQNRLDDYRASVVLHEASLKKLKALLAVRRGSYEQLVRAARGRMEKASLDLKKAPVISFIKAERNRLAHQEAAARYQQLQNEARYVEISEGAAIRRSELDLQVSRMELQRAERSLQRMLVAAPMDGLVVLQSIQRGGEMGQIGPGDRLHAGQPYMSIVDTRSMIVNARANQVDAERLRPGARARVHFDAYPDLELPAHVIAVGAFALGGGWRASYVKTIPVRLKLDKLDRRVIPDLSVSADLILAAERDAVTVPREAVFSDAGGPYAFVQDDAGWERRPLEPGLANNVVSAIHSGLREGETVAAEQPPPGSPR